MKQLQFLPVLAAVAWVVGCEPSYSAPQPAVRQGNVWIQTYTGDFTPPLSGNLRVETPGDLVVRGCDSGRVSYVLRVFVQAESAQQLRSVGITRSGGDLRVRHGSGSGIITRMEILVPKHLRYANLRTRGGDVEAYDFNGALDAASAGGRIRMDRIGGSVLARTGGGSVLFGMMRSNVRVLSAGGSIQVNSVGGESWFETAGGEIFIGESHGPVHAVTGGGNIRVGRSASAVMAQTAGGRIEVQQAGGIVTAENSSGSIQIGSAPGVQCESDSGLIRLQGVSGALRAITNAGSILAELVAGRPLLDSILSTGAGDINVFIPSNIALTVRAQSDSGRLGRIISEFAEIPVRVSTSVMLAEGTLNGGGPMLQVSAVRGTIYLRRRK
jgi:hypothetical protein